MGILKSDPRYEAERSNEEQNVEVNKLFAFGILIIWENVKVKCYFCNYWSW